jgi:hypothetical protein
LGSESGKVRGPVEKDTAGTADGWAAPDEDRKGKDNCQHTPAVGKYRVCRGKSESEFGISGTRRNQADGFPMWNKEIFEGDRNRTGKQKGPRP